MRFTLDIMTKYIDHHPTASMTKNPLTGIIALSKVCNVNKANVLGHKNVVFSLVSTAHLQP
jgi:hypothetical protein